MARMGLSSHTSQLSGLHHHVLCSLKDEFAVAAS